MPPRGKGKGKGKGKKGGGGAAGNDNAGGGGKGPNDMRKENESWQCRHCGDKVWSTGAFCTGCGGSKSACERPPRKIPDPNLDKLMEENGKLRKEMDGFRKDMQKRVTDKTPDKKPGEGGAKGNGGRSLYPPAASANPPSLATANPPQPKNISNRDILVQFDGANISLATLHEMLEYAKRHFAEGHKRVTEIP